MRVLILKDQNLQWWCILSLKFLPSMEESHRLSFQPDRIFVIFPTALYLFLSDLIILN